MKQGEMRVPVSRASLLRRIRSPADDLAWREFISTYQPFVRLICTNCGVRTRDLDDLVQEVFLRIATRIQNFEYDPERGRFRDWLRIVTQNCVYTIHRKSKRPGMEPGVGGDHFSMEVTKDDDSVCVDLFGAAVLQSAMLKIVEEFDRPTWAAFELVWCEDVKPVHVASIMQRKIGWVYKAKFKVMQRLEEEVAYLCHDSASLQRPIQGM